MLAFKPILATLAVLAASETCTTCDNSEATSLLQTQKAQKRVQANHSGTSGDASGDAGIEVNVWVKMPSKVSPPPRDLAVMVWDEKHKTALLFGGQATANPVALGDFWRYDPQALLWTELKTIGAPSARWGSVAVWDDDSDTMLFFGGSTGGVDRENELWRYDPEAHLWHLEAQVGPKPPAEEFGTAVWDKHDKAMIICDGIAAPRAGLVAPDVWKYTKAKIWVRVPAPKTHPGGRIGAVAVWDDDSDTMLLFGGYTPSPSHELWRYDPKVNLWVELKPFGGPSSRAGAAAVWDTDSDCMLLFGGDPLNNGAPGQVSNELWRYDPKTNSWKQLLQAPKPHALYQAAAAWDTESKTMFLFGGRTAGGVGGTKSDELWRLYPKDD